MPPEAYLAAVAGALATVAGLFYKNLLERIKRSEDREDKRDAQFDRLADLLENALGVKVPRQ